MPLPDTCRCPSSLTLSLMLHSLPINHLVLQVFLFFSITELCTTYQHMFDKSLTVTRHIDLTAVSGRELGGEEMVGRVILIIILYVVCYNRLQCLQGLDLFVRWTQDTVAFILKCFCIVSKRKLTPHFNYRTFCKSLWQSWWHCSRCFAICFLAEICTPLSALFYFIFFPFR